MTRIQIIEKEVKKFDRSSLAAFRNWFQKYDAAMWDEQLVKDIRAGKLAKLAQEAHRAHRTDKTKEF